MEAEKLLIEKNNLKVPRDGLYGMIILSLSFLICIIIVLIVGYNKFNTINNMIIIIAFLLFYIFLGWGIPFYIYSLAPKSITIRDNEIVIKYKIGRKDKKYTKNQILKVRLIKSYMSGEILCQIFYGSKQNDLITVNHEAGIKVYDWYYGYKEEDGPRPIKNFYWRDKKKK